MSIRAESSIEAVRIAPAGVVAAAPLAGIALETWVLYLTILYLALSIAHLIYKFIRDRKTDVKD